MKLIDSSNFISPHSDGFILLSGFGDFVSLIKLLKSLNKYCVVLSTYAPAYKFDWNECLKFISYF